MHTLYAISFHLLKNLTMINLEFNASTLLGVCLVATSIGLYAVRKIRPELSRDSDVVFSTLGIAAGSILTFQGWRLDPILLFSQTCSIGVALFLFGKVFAYDIATIIQKKIFSLVKKTVRADNEFYIKAGGYPPSLEIKRK